MKTFRSILSAVGLVIFSFVSVFAVPNQQPSFEETKAAIELAVSYPSSKSNSIYLLDLAKNAVYSDLSLSLDKPVNEKQLLNALCTDNIEECEKAIFYLGELRSQKAVIPLLRVFNNSENEGLRVLAALSLLKIQDGRGIKALSYAAQHDSNDFVKKMCGNFYGFYKQNS